MIGLMRIGGDNYMDAHLDYPKETSMREITDHKVNPANDTIKINVVDQPGAGGACHEYDVALPSGATTRITMADLKRMEIAMTREAKGRRYAINI